MPHYTGSQRFSSIGAHVTVNEALGQSEAFLAFQERLSRVAPINRPVLFMGERGTGKELAAVRLHYLSARWQGPLVALNCAALTPSLIGAELFGHEKGAFTGAFQRQSGRFETADNGTLFLDEIGAIPLEVQAKILRVVEYGTFERVGSSQPVRVDVRIIAATNADLKALCAQGRFMPDLLDRLSFEVLFLPPLRERKDDILLLARHFAARMAQELGREEVPDFAPEAESALLAHLWPGNVRELKNVVERAVYSTDASLIRNVVFDPFQSRTSAPAPDTGHSGSRETEHPKDQNAVPDLFGLPFMEARQKLEQTYLANALETARYNQRQAAKLMGLTYHQFRGLYRKHGL